MVSHLIKGKMSHQGHSLLVEFKSVTGHIDRACPLVLRWMESVQQSLSLLPSPPQVFDLRQCHRQMQQQAAVVVAGRNSSLSSEEGMALSLGEQWTSFCLFFSLLFVRGRTQLVDKYKKVFSYHKKNTHLSRTGV